MKAIDFALQPIMTIELKKDPNWFPPVASASDDGDWSGFLAIGGDLSVERLLAAYQRSIFPWFNDRPIMWWTPNPRTVIFPESVYISKRLNRLRNSGKYQMTWNQSFDDVVHECSRIRGQDNSTTWISDEIKFAYGKLHQLGHAQSCEVRRDGVLVGGIYGVVIGRVFFGESMFHRESNTSKLALIEVALCGKFDLVDCQVSSEHVMKLGAELIDRQHFVQLLDKLCHSQTNTV